MIEYSPKILLSTAGKRSFTWRVHPARIDNKLSYHMTLGSHILKLAQLAGKDAV